MTTSMSHSDLLIRHAGDFNKKWNVYLFKVVIEGVSGDDGNLYRFFMSRDPDSDIAG